MSFLSSFAFCAILINTAVFFTTCANVSDSNGTALDVLDGQDLILLGRKIKNPLLTLLGRTINKFHACTEWAQWSTCKPSVLKYFGTRSRQRKCQKNVTTKKEETNEKTFELCEILCREGYNATENVFCMKFYETKTKQDAAEKQCEEDGGHLINIDSELKHRDVKNYLHGIREHVWLDGRRKDPKSPWKFTYGSQTRYIKWAPGQPDDASNSLCLVLDKSDSRPLHDTDCGAALTFLCEVNTQ